MKLSGILYMTCSTYGWNNTESLWPFGELISPQWFSSFNYAKRIIFDFWDCPTWTRGGPTESRELWIRTFQGLKPHYNNQKRCAAKIMMELRRGFVMLKVSHQSEVALHAFVTSKRHSCGSWVLDEQQDWSRPNRQFQYDRKYSPTWVNPSH